MTAKSWIAAFSAVAMLSGCGGGSDYEDLSRAMGWPATVGPVCGDPEILGVVLPELHGPGSCGIAEPVRVYAVSGVVLDGEPRINCRTARATRVWVETGAKPAVSPLNARLTSMTVVADYACRRRNNRPSGKLSEHAKGNAIDISAFTLSDGQRFEVRDWRRDSRYAASLRRLHASACGPFGTVLGPEADRYHEDHFHFDVADYRSGSYCR